MLMSFMLLLTFLTSCKGRGGDKNDIAANSTPKSELIAGESSVKEPAYTLLVLPRNPLPGESFRILSTGYSNLKKAKIIVEGPNGEVNSCNTIYGSELPYWRIDSFPSSVAGDYKVYLELNRKTVCTNLFSIQNRGLSAGNQKTWITRKGWDKNAEAQFSAWINALFYDCDERSSWGSLHEVTQNVRRNFLYNYLSLGEDDPESNSHIIMKPDCADNPFFLRAYFAWKLGLPFGYHICDRGYLGRNPQTGEWITNETATTRSNTVDAFNAFLRRVMDGVHSGTARTSFENDNSDYYPVALERNSLLPGTVYADPYGHTLVIIRWVGQERNSPGLLLAVDAQPDGTVAVKRFWKGNFLFNTVDVVGEPGFKVFRPIILNNGRPILVRNSELTDTSGFVSYSLQQRKMDMECFYSIMERLINPSPLDAEAALNDLIKALHEQLTVRVTSVANAEVFFRTHKGTIIPMPSKPSAIFQSGGEWENYSTPNRDLRLLIAMDAVITFPDVAANAPEQYNSKSLGSDEKVKDELQNILEKKARELTITYNRSDGSAQTLTLWEIIKRREAFEMAYNPNDGPEIRWGAPEDSEERSTCRRRAPQTQIQTMKNVKGWFSKRLHPPT